jgi:preprotein translocase subunit SecG
MAFISAILTSFFVVVCLLLIIVILLQPGKGEGLGALGGMSTQFFGGGGATTFLAKLTTGLAIGYMVLVIFLAKVSQPSTDIETVPSIPVPLSETSIDATVNDLAPSTTAPESSAPQDDDGSPGE